MHYILFYDYVDNILERRTPHRPDHLALVNEFHERGHILIAGAWADPVDGAALVFQDVDRAAVEEFAERDPYVQNGLVTSWRVREWAVVVGADGE